MNPHGKVTTNQKPTIDRQKLKKMEYKHTAKENHQAKRQKNKKKNKRRGNYKNNQK